MSTSIYERESNESLVEGPPTSRRRRIYRREVYGEAERSFAREPHRNHVKKPVSAVNIVLIVLMVVASLLVVAGVAMFLKGRFSDQIYVPQQQENLLSPRR